MYAVALVETGCDVGSNPGKYAIAAWPRSLISQRVSGSWSNCKFSMADVEERKFWKQYIKAYGECLSATSKKEAPWYIVPADDKENARLIVSQVILDAMDDLKMAYPTVNAERRKELQRLRKDLGGENN